MFAVVVESSEVRAHSNTPVVTNDGDKFIIVNSEWGVTSNHFFGRIPPETKIFTTTDKIEQFTEHWNCPWWCKPNGKYLIVELGVSPEIGEYVPVSGVFKNKADIYSKDVI